MSKLYLSLLLLGLGVKVYSRYNPDEKGTPYLVCSGSNAMGWLAPPGAPNQYEFGTDRDKIQENRTTDADRLGTCSCMTVSSGDAYLWCSAGISQKGEVQGGKAKLLPFQSTYPAICLEAESCPNKDEFLKSESMKKVQGTMICMTGHPVGFITNEGEFKAEVSSATDGTGCKCSKAESTDWPKFTCDQYPKSIGVDPTAAYCAVPGLGCGTATLGQNGLK